MTNYYLTETAAPGDLAPLEATNLAVDALSSGPPDDCEIFFVNGQQPSALEKLCRAIRQHPCPTVYLRPVVAVECNGTLPGYPARLVDGQIAHGSLHELAIQGVRDIARPINEVIASLPDVAVCKDSNIAVKILRFLHTRQQKMLPFRSSRTIYGLGYPELELFMRQRDESIFNLLQFLEDQNLLQGRFFEKVHRCNQCASAYLNFQEICPQCNGADLKVDELIHHFSCAHVAPEVDFMAAGRLVCPKCDHELRHLGADYDKPSAVYKCNQCRHTTQDPVIATTCYHCGAKALPEDLVQVIVKSYTLTALGENAAINGLDNLFTNILERQISTLPLPTFRIVLEVEIQRIKRYQRSTSSLLLFQLTDMEEIMLRLGQRTKDLFAEMSTIIKAVLRTSDLTASLNESTFVVLMPETPRSGAEIALKRLRDQLASLFTTNLDIAVTMRQGSLELTAEDTVDDCLDRLLRHATVQ